MTRTLRRRRIWLFFGVLGLVAAGVAAIGLVVAGVIGQQQEWAAYAGTYVARSGDRLQLHDDGTWVLTWAEGTETTTGGVPGGDIGDLDWVVLARGEPCQECGFLGEPPRGDPIIYVPGTVVSSTTWAGSDVSVRTIGDYYGVVDGGAVLVGADGRRWTRVRPGAG